MLSKTACLRKKKDNGERSLLGDDMVQQQGKSLLRHSREKSEVAWVGIQQPSI